MTKTKVQGYVCGKHIEAPCTERSTQVARGGHWPDLVNLFKTYLDDELFYLLVQSYLPGKKTSYYRAMTSL